MGHSECKTTWEPAPTLSPSLVADYEAGILKEIVTESELTYGHTSVTLISVDDVVQEPAAKKAKVDDLSQEPEHRSVIGLPCTIVKL